MPTQPVVWACKVNVMLSPLTAYVIVYAPFDEDLTPKHMSASCKAQGRYYSNAYSRIWPYKNFYMHLLLCEYFELSAIE